MKPLPSILQSSVEGWWHKRGEKTTERSEDADHRFPGNNKNRQIVISLYEKAF